MQVDGFQAAESPLHLGQALAGADCRGIIEVGCRHVGALVLGRGGPESRASPSAW